MSQVMTEQLEARGIAYHVKKVVENGVERNIVIIDKVPPIEQEIAKFFAGSLVTTNPELLELKEKYDADIKELTSSCTSCEKGAIMRKYHYKVKEILVNESKHTSRTL